MSVVANRILQCTGLPCSLTLSGIAVAKPTCASCLDFAGISRSRADRGQRRSTRVAAPMRAPQQVQLDEDGHPGILPPRSSDQQPRQPNPRRNIPRGQQQERHCAIWGQGSGSCQLMVSHYPITTW